VDEAVGDGGGSGAVVEQVAPVLEGQVGGDDGGGALVALVEDLVEQVGAAGVEAQVAELVDEEKVGSRPSGEAAVEGVAGLAGDEVVDEIGGEYEADAVAAQARELTDGIGEMGFADSARTEKDAVGLVTNEVERGGTGDDVSVDGFGVIEVIGIDSGEREDGGVSMVPIIDGAPSTLFDVRRAEVDQARESEIQKGRSRSSESAGRSASSMAAA
jgi:hypothetical protein